MDQPLSVNDAACAPSRPLVFLDFEASSLRKRSWPVEVAWVREDGTGVSRLIRPAVGWDDWDERAERIHGLPRSRLQQEGADVAEVAGLMMAELAGAGLYASAPSWDGKWLSVLLRGAGMPRHALRLEPTGVALRQAARRVLAEGGMPPEQQGEAVRTIIDALRRDKEEGGPPVHRALADARGEWQRWRRAQDLARDALRR